MKPLKKWYATLPCGSKVTVPEDTVDDFKTLYKGVPLEDSPTESRKQFGVVGKR